MGKTTRRLLTLAYYAATACGMLGLMMLFGSEGADSDARFLACAAGGAAMTWAGWRTALRLDRKLYGGGHGS